MVAATIVRVGGLAFGLAFSLARVPAQTWLRLPDDGASPARRDTFRALDEDSRFPGLRLPVLTFVHDPAGASLRPIIGVPGSAVVGSPVDLGFEITQALVSPRQDYVLMAKRGGGELAILECRARSFNLRSTGLEVTERDRMFSSPTGRSVALYREDMQHVQILQGFPGAPVLYASIDLSSVPRPMSAMAVSDDGSMFLAGAGQGGVGTLHAYATVCNRPQVKVMQEVSAIAFFHDGNDAVVVDRAQGRLYILRADVASEEGDISLRDIPRRRQIRYLNVESLPVDFGGPAKASTVEAGYVTPAPSMTIRLSHDNHMALIADVESQIILTVDLATGEVESIPCQCRPTGFYPLKGGNAFRLNGLPEGPIMMLEFVNRVPRILRVPADGTGER